jgi:5-methylcytosine-specific restriction endonuclease McrA
VNNLTAELRRQVIARAARTTASEAPTQPQSELDGARCEYCQLAQAGQEAAFHIDHVLPKSKGGPTELTNLALACVSCSLRKAARTAAIDPLSRTQTTLFNPRQQNWSDHFQWRGEYLLAHTPTGRATIEALQLNRPLILAIRREEIAHRRHPPSR